jgi:hypothetical protein
MGAPFSLMWAARCLSRIGRADILGISSAETRIVPVPTGIAGRPFLHHWTEQFEFDPAQFKSSQPCQPTRSLPGDLPKLCKEPTFPYVSGQKPSLWRRVSGVLRREPEISLPVSTTDFSISEICARDVSEAGCVFAESGSNPRREVDARSRVSLVAATMARVITFW